MMPADLPYTLVDWRDVVCAVPADDLEALCESVSEDHANDEKQNDRAAIKLHAR